MTVGLIHEPFFESNPIPVAVPREGVSPELYGFLTDLMGDLRRTYSKNQLGDSSHNWQIMLSVDDLPTYTLGSQGSFYHPTYGTFCGVYVQFESMDSGGLVGGPVGYTKSLWGVTNQLVHTRDGKCQGLLCAESIPAAGKYGWIITRGVNFWQLPVEDTVKLKDSISWTDAGLVTDTNVSAFAQVNVLGDSVIPPGGLILESVDLPASLPERTIALEQRIQELEAQLHESQTSLSALIGQQLDQGFDSLQTQLNGLSRRITNITPDGSSVKDTQLLQSITNLSNSAGLSRKQAQLAARLGATQLAATTQFVREARTGRDQARIYSEASGNFSVEAGLSAANSFQSADASAGFSAQAGTYADAAGVSAASALDFKTAAEAASASASGSATAAGGFASDASTSEANAYAYSLVAASNQIDLTTLTATVTTQASAITDIQGRQEAWFEVEAIAGDNTASITIRADNDGGRISLVGDVDIHGDLLVDGTINSQKYEPSSVSQTYFYIGTTSIVIPHA